MSERIDDDTSSYEASDVDNRGSSEHSDSGSLQDEEHRQEANATATSRKATWQPSSASLQPSEYERNATRRIEKVRQQHSSRQGRRALKARCTREYRDLLDSLIDDVNDGSTEVTSPLPPSQIGASYWTLTEKEAFFAKLASCGPGELLDLSGAVGSKSASEVKLYLQLLQEGAVEVNATLHPRDGFQLAHAPAAVDVGASCESALESAADALALRVEQQDVVAEKERFDERWLIDEDTAAMLDDEYEAQNAHLLNIDDSSDDVPAGADGRTSQSVLSTNPIANDDLPHPTSDGASNTSVPSAHLLSPSSFLQLSASIFMNGPPGTGANWRDQPPSPSHPSGTPAIYYTAFDDLHTLAISLTRRLVSASIFQAMTRLRANDTARSNQRPVPVVSAVDVRTAVDIVGMKTDSRVYWAKLPRRYQVAVYSEMAKYKDGRKGSKHGVKLTYGEVEAELGLSAADVGTDIVARSDFDSSDMDSDMFTEESIEDTHSTSWASDGDSSGPSSEEKESPATRSEPGPAPSNRKRALSPTSFARAEDRYLETLDTRASDAEEHRLWAALNLEPPPEPLPPDSDAFPSPPTKRQKSDDPVGMWRDRVRYEAEWEHHAAPVKVRDFVAMEVRGRERRERRWAKSERLRGHGEDGADGMDDGEAVEAEDVDGGVSEEDEMDTDEDE